MEKNGVNLETWDVLTGSGRGGDDYLAEGANRSGAISRSYDVVSGSVKSRSSVDLVGEDTQVKEFIVGEGQLIDSEEVQRQAEDFAMRAAWGVVSAKGTSVGLEFLRPGKTVLFKMGSFKRFPGEYFIRSVEHDYDLKRDIGYVSRWDLVRSFQYSGEFNPSLKSAIAPSASYGRGAPGSIDSDLLGVSPQSASVGLQPTGDVASVFSTGGQ